MKRISLLRHAKAADRTPAMKDIDRPLTPRGRADAALIGDLLARSERRPDVALCSPAARTRETLDAVCARLDEPLHKIFDDEIYNAAAGQLLAAIKALPEDRRHVLLVGHNPGVHQFALQIARPAADGAMDEIREKFPKGALAEFDLEANAWNAITFATGRLIRFVRLKDLR